MFYVYILRSVKFGVYYVGCTKDIKKRLKLHNDGFVKSTQNKKPWELLYQEKYESLNEARQRELKIKSWKRRSAIGKLISGR